MSLVTVGVIAVAFAHWGLTAKDALDRGIFNFDSLWYHMPYAVEFAKSHSVTGFHPTETVLTNWFYPQNAELLHGIGILVTGRDTLSLFLNFGWLAIAFLAAWCVGRPYGRGPLCVASTAIVLECHTLVVREPGAGKNDVVAAALILAAIAILLNAASRSGGGRTLPVGWPLAAAGLAVGLAVGTKLTAVAIAAALTVAVIALAPAGRRLAASGWWFGAALAGGGYWYLRNLIAAGNPLPQAEHLGPIGLPHPERLQTGRPDHSILHYATDTGVWHEYFAPGLHDAFGALWPLVVLGAIAGPLIALVWGRDRVLRSVGAVVVVGMLAYLVTPLGAAGAEGAPVGFAINIRFVLPAMLAGAALLPLAPGLDRERSRWIALAVLLGVLLLTDRADAVLRDPSRLFGLLVAAVAVLVPAALIFFFTRRRAAPAALTAAFAGLALVAVAIGYPVQRHYLGDRFGPGSEIPGMDLNSAVRLGPGQDRRQDRPGGDHGRFPRLWLLRHRSLERRQLHRCSRAARRLQRDPHLQRVPRRGQRRRPRLPRHGAVPQLHPSHQPGALARGRVAPWRAGGRAGSAQPGGDRLACRRATRPERLRA